MRSLVLLHIADLFGMRDRRRKKSSEPSVFCLSPLRAPRECRSQCSDKHSAAEHVVYGRGGRALAVR